MTPSDYIQQLEETIKRLTVERDALIEQKHKLEREIEELKKKLRFYENPEIQR